jgi:hypothetical protein
MNSYFRHAELPIDSILSFLALRFTFVGMGRNCPAKIKLRKKHVKVSSVRLQTFANTYRKYNKLICEHCGLEATYCTLDSHVDQMKKGVGPKGIIPPAHINFFGRSPEGELILFTHDHILAQGLGGASTHMDNCQTLCTVCNGAKSKDESLICNLLESVFINRRVEILKITPFEFNLFVGKRLRRWIGDRKFRPVYYNNQIVRGWELEP